MAGDLASPPNEDIMALAMDEHQPSADPECDRGEVVCICDPWKVMSIEDWFVHLKVEMTEAWREFYWRKRQRHNTWDR